MADYIPIIASETDPEAPLRSSLLKRLEANPRAIAEGAAGAPKVNGTALAGVYLTSLSTTTMTPIGVVGVGRARQFIAQCCAVYNGFTGVDRVVQARYTSDNGGSWGAWQDVVAVAAPAAGNPGWRNFTFAVDVVTGAFSAVGLGRQVGDFVVVSGSGTHTAPPGCNGMQLRWNSSGMTLAAAFYCLGGAS